MSACGPGADAPADPAALARASHYVDPAAGRAAIVQRCGECHEKVYASWKAGPHSHAWSALAGHLEAIDGARSFPPGYHAFVKDRIGSICATCHTGRNLFETNFDEVVQAVPASLDKARHPRAFAAAAARDVANQAEVATGVDCLTCHLRGGEVVGRVAGAGGVGLVRSPLLTSNLGCRPCHHHQVDTMKDLVKDGKLAAEQSCIGCHQERGARGQGTHYFFWRHDAPGRSRPGHLDIFAGVQVERAALAGQGLTVRWANDVMPHGYSECGEARAELVAVMKDGMRRPLARLLLNRKGWFDALENLPEHFRAGTNGHPFTYGEPLEVTVAGIDPDRVDHVVVKGYVKPQYWSDESEFVLVAEKRLSITERPSKSS